MNNYSCYRYLSYFERSRCPMHLQRWMRIDLWQHHPARKHLRRYYRRPQFLQRKIYLLIKNSKIIRLKLKFSFRVTPVVHWLLSTEAFTTRSVSWASALPPDAKSVIRPLSLAFHTTLTGSRPSLAWSSKSACPRLHFIFHHTQYN